MRNCLLFFFALFIQSNSLYAKVYGPSVRELPFRYEAEFLTKDLETSSSDLALEHTQYLFGLMQSPKVIESHGIRPDLVGGIGAIRFPIQIRVISRKKIDEDSVLIQYSARGAMILHQKATRKILANGGLFLPMPYEVGEIYDRKCTDEHYWTEGDYWYFYDVFRRGCTYLTKEPYAKMVEIKVSENSTEVEDPNPRLDLLRGNNGNGDAFTIDIIHGFSESSKSRRDEGRLGFLEVNKELVSRGFDEDIEQSHWTRPLHVFTKTIQMANGNSVNVMIRHLLVDTDIDSRGTSFAKFFKDAVENSDVVVYSGHSGLGGNLDIDALEEKAGEFQFNHKKRQIFYFDSCSSYSYYLNSFEKMKTKSRLDVLTNGLSSYFETGTSSLMVFLDALMAPKDMDSWGLILKRIESVLNGGSYLLNVGAI